MEATVSIDITGAWVLGHNQMQGGSELQSGARAELIPSPITKALSSFKGRVAAKTMSLMFSGHLQTMLNYMALRPFAEMQAVKMALGDNPIGKVVLDPAAGFAPQFFWLADEFPDTQFIELDRNSTIELKRTLLAPFTLPENLQLISADLSTEFIHDVVYVPADVILTIGAYVTHPDYQAMLRYLKQTLKSTGKVIGIFPYAPGIDNLNQSSSIFRRLAGDPIGMVHDEAELHAIFEGAGYTIESIIKFSDIAKKLGKPTPADIEIMVIATLP